MPCIARTTNCQLSHEEKPTTECKLLHILTNIRLQNKTKSGQQFVYYFADGGIKERIFLRLKQAVST